MIDEFFSFKLRSIELFTSLEFDVTVPTLVPSITLDDLFKFETRPFLSTLLSALALVRVSILLTALATLIELLMTTLLLLLLLLLFALLLLLLLLLFVDESIEFFMELFVDSLLSVAITFSLNLVHRLNCSHARHLF